MSKDAKGKEYTSLNREQTAKLRFKHGLSSSAKSKAISKKKSKFEKQEHEYKLEERRGYPRGFKMNKSNK